MNLSFSPQTDLGLTVYSSRINDNIFNIDLASVTTRPYYPQNPPFHRMLWRILQELLISTTNTVEIFAINELLSCPYVEFKFTRSASNTDMLAILILEPFKSTILFESDNKFMQIFKTFGLNKINTTILPELQYVERWTEIPNHPCIMLFNICQIQDQDDDHVFEEVLLAFGVYRTSFIEYIKNKASILLEKIHDLQIDLDAVDDVMLKLGL